MANWSYSLVIEGVGNSDGQFRLATYPVGFDTDNLYRVCMVLYPEETSAEVDVQGGSSTIGGLNGTLLHISEEGEDMGRWFMTTIPRKVGEITGALTTTSTTVATSAIDGSLANTMVMVGREAIHLGAYGGAGIYACVRAQLGTFARAHGVGVADDTAMFDASRLVHALDRGVELRRVRDDAADYSEEETLWAGVLSDISEPTPGEIRVDSESVLALLADLKIGQNLWRGSKTQPEDTVRKIAALFEGDGVPYSTSPYITVEGKTCAKPLYVVSGGTRTHVRIYRSDILPGCPPWEGGSGFSWVAETLRCDGDPTSSTDSLPFSRNRVTRVLQILTTSADGDNGAYDMGVEDLGCGIPVERIDVAAFEDARGRLGDEANDDNAFLFVDNEPLEVLDYIDTILHPHGLILTSSLNGKITLFALQDMGTPSVTLTEDDFLHDPTVSASPRIDSAVDVVSVQWDGLPGVSPRTSTFTDVLATKRTQRARKGGVSLDLSDIAVESKARRIAVWHNQRFRNPLPYADGASTRLKNLDIGDLVSVTHSRLRNPTTGGRNVVGGLFQCTSRRAVLEEGRVKFRLIYVGAIYERTGLIAPSGEVKAYSSGTNTLTLETDTYQSGDHPTYTADADGFSGGDYIDILDATGAPIHENIVLVDTFGDELYLGATGLSPAPAAGNIVTHSIYSEQPTPTTDAWAFLDGGADLGSDAPYQWTI